MYICHACDNPACCNPSHLFLGTQFDNMQDMVKKGRINNRAGENNPKAKLSESDIFEIYRLYNSGMSAYRISKMYKVAGPTILGVVKGITWKHLWDKVTHVR